MATSNEYEIVSGGYLDIILELLESDFLDEETEVQAAFEDAIEEIVDGEFCCSVCGKKCKSKGGLTRHKNAKHEAGTSVGTSESNENGFTIEDYCQLVNQSAKSLSEDECYPESIRKEFETYVFNVVEEDYQAAKERFAQINMLYTSVKRKRNVEKLYSKYFSLVPLKATEYFPGLPFQLSVLLATRVADKIISFCKDNDSNSTPAEEIHVVTARDLIEKEKAALQYLGGYEVISLFDQWVTSAELEVSKNVSEHILHQALMLYVKVRYFSFAKDVINKYKAQKKSSKSKALRTDLKRTSDQPTVLE